MSRWVDLYTAIDFKELISVPLQLRRRKIKIKWGSGAAVLNEGASQNKPDLIHGKNK